MTNEEQQKIKSLICDIFDLSLDRSILTVYHDGNKTTYTVTNNKQLHIVYTAEKHGVVEDIPSPIPIDEYYSYTMTVDNYNGHNLGALVDSTSIYSPADFLVENASAINTWVKYIMRGG